MIRKILYSLLILSKFFLYVSIGLLLASVANMANAIYRYGVHFLKQFSYFETTLGVATTCSILIAIILQATIKIIIFFFFSEEE